jgi:erythromycin esterase
MIALTCFLTVASITAQPVAQPAQPDPADPRVEWIRANVITVRTIDPVDEDFTDLEPLVTVIGDARVVMLGEQTHGDGACFKAKSRLVKFLHQRMGFDVLAFESGMFDMGWANEALRAGESTSELHRRGLFGIWANSAQCLPALQYAKASAKSPRPLELAGFDNQFSASDSRDAFVMAFIMFMDQASPELLSQEQREAIAELAQWIGQFSAGGQDPSPLAARIDAIDPLFVEQQAALHAAHAPRDVAFMRRALRNMASFARQLHAGRTPETLHEGGRIRDTAMGENIIFLANEYFAGRKVIIWAASMHNMRNTPRAQLLHDRDAYKDTVTMGMVAHESLGDDIYSIMFTAHSGRAGKPWDRPWPVQPAPKGSIDALFHEAGVVYGLIDLKNPARGGEWLRERLVARPLGYAPCEGVWPDHCDAFFHTDVMEPSTVARHE